MHILRKFRFYFPDKVLKVPCPRCEASSKDLCFVGGAVTGPCEARSKDISSIDEETFFDLQVEHYFNL